MNSHWPNLLALSLLWGMAPAFAAESDDRAALETASQAWVAAWNARGADAMAALTTEDVVLLNPDGSPVSGREKARAAWRQSMPRDNARIGIADKETVLAGDFAWKIAAVSRLSPDGTRAKPGYVLEIWKRVGGRWLLHRQMPSSLLTYPGLAPRPLPSEPVLDKSRD